MDPTATVNVHSSVVAAATYRWGKKGQRGLRLGIKVAFNAGSFRTDPTQRDQTVGGWFEAPSEARQAPDGTTMAPRG